ncbi:thioredoxin domain-containing protein 3 isoform X2 [Ascaphus truei]|uniref:thioredoxin domain-containing protein 3 isoform X2 n=1 Tax=Ascaphus truei TaxID=8439 RepID=UPI003F5AB202
MSSKKKEIQLQTVITTQEQWDEMLLSKGVTVVDVHQAWCGPCKAVLTLFRKLRSDFGDDILHFAVATADNIETLKRFRGKCEPAFLICSGGIIVSMVKGVNAPLLIKTVINAVEAEGKIIAGVIQRDEIKEIKLSVSDIKPVQEDLPTEEITRPDECYTVAIIKPDAVANEKTDEIKDKIKQAGYSILSEEHKVLSEEQVRAFYSNSGKPDFEDFVRFMSSGPCCILIVYAGKEEKESVPQWKELTDETAKPAVPKRKASLQDVVGNDAILNVCKSEDSKDEASKMLAFFFPNFNKHKSTEQAERTLAIIRPDLLREKKDAVLERIRQEGFVIAMQREIMLTEQQASEFYKEHEGQDYFPALIKNMTSGPVLALGLSRENAVQRWRQLLGPKILEEAREKDPVSLRAAFSVENVSINQLHGSSTPDDATKDFKFFFPVQNTLAVIKPDAMDHKDDIIHKAEEAGFTLSEIKETRFSREMASQFYKVHEGKPFFDHLVDCMSEGNSTVMVLTKENAIEEWRNLIGPTDPEVAKTSCPNSIRAQFAQSILQNSVHGSSSEKHAVESMKFIFGEINVDHDHTTEEFMRSATEPPTLPDHGIAPEDTSTSEGIGLATSSESSSDHSLENEEVSMTYEVQESATELPTLPDHVIAPEDTSTSEGIGLATSSERSPNHPEENEDVSMTYEVQGSATELPTLPDHVIAPEDTSTSEGIGLATSLERSPDHPLENEDVSMTYEGTNECSAESEIQTQAEPQMSDDKAL